METKFALGLNSSGKPVALRFTDDGELQVSGVNGRGAGDGVIKVDGILLKGVDAEGMPTFLRVDENGNVKVSGAETDEFDGDKTIKGDLTIWGQLLSKDGTPYGYINVKNDPFNAVGDGVADDTAAIQAALDYANTSHAGVYVPSGIYKITSTLTYNTTIKKARGLRLLGAGSYTTVFDNRVANGPMLYLNGYDGNTTTAFTFAYQAHLSEFQIRTFTSHPANSDGIQLRSQWFPTIERVVIGHVISGDATNYSVTGNAINIVNDYSDADGTAYLEIKHCDLIKCGKFAINSTDPPLNNGSLTNNASGPITVEGCRIENNAGGGIRVVGLAWKIVESSIAGNGPSGGFIGGVYIPRLYNAVSGIGQTVQKIYMRNNEFDTNLDVHLNVEALVAGRIENCRFVGRTITTTLVQLGKTDSPNTTNALVANVVLDNCMIDRRDGSITAVKFTLNSSSCKFINTYYNGLTGVTKFTDLGTNNVQEDNGYEYHSAIPYLANNLNTSYTPDTYASVWHRVFINATGAFTMNAPIFTGGNLRIGQELILTIANVSGGVITVSFNAVYKVSGFTAPTNNLTTSARFAYNGSTWYQIGGWSTPV